MTDNFDKTFAYANLKMMIERHGPCSIQARNASIGFCIELGLDPYFKFPIFDRVSLGNYIPTCDSPKYNEQWEVVISHYMRFD